jgi:hypothetical protein
VDRLHSSHAKAPADHLTKDPGAVVQPTPRSCQGRQKNWESVNTRTKAGFSKRAQSMALTKVPFRKPRKRATAAKNKLDVRFWEEHPRRHVLPSPNPAGILALLRSDGRFGRCGMGTGGRRRWRSTVGSTHSNEFAGIG